MMIMTLGTALHAHKSPATGHEALHLVGAWAFPPSGDSTNSTKMLAMAPRARVLEAWRVVQHVNAVHVPGDIVEAGVFRGGTMMVMAWSEMVAKPHFGRHRTLWLYDTFEGLPPPTTEDGDKVKRKWSAAKRLRPGDSDDKGGTASPYVDADGVTRWCYGAESEVRQNMNMTGYPSQHALRQRQG